MNQTNLLHRLEAVLRDTEHADVLPTRRLTSLRVRFRDALRLGDETGIDLYGDVIGKMTHVLDVLSADPPEDVRRRMLQTLASQRALLYAFLGQHRFPLHPNKTDFSISEALKERDAEDVMRLSVDESWLSVDQDDLSFQPVQGKYGDFFVAREDDGDLLGYAQVDDLPSTERRPMHMTRILNIGVRPHRRADTIRNELLQAISTRLRPIGQSTRIVLPPPSENSDHPDRAALERAMRTHGFSQLDTSGEGIAHILDAKYS